MSKPDLPTVILGSGPAGLALGIRLAQRGRSAVVFDDSPSGGVLVGESLSGATIAHLRELGVEEEVAAMAYRKRGTRYVSRNQDVVDLSLEAALPGYSYNVERPAFDAILRQRAVDLGVRFVKRHAELEVYQLRSGEVSVRLNPMSAALAGYFPGEASPLLVDATGRKRLVAGLLRVPMVRSRRNNLAYFAHFDGFKQSEEEAGMCVINVLKAGWSWRIPLCGDRTSLGLVVSREQSAALGSTPEERLMRVIRSEPALRSAGLDARRVSPVFSQPSQEMMALRGYGPGWVLLGDAFGQLDPMLSAGVYTALESARRLDEWVLTLHPEPGLKQGMALARYSAQMTQLYRSWSQLSDYYYSGQFFAAFRKKHGTSHQRTGGMVNMLERYARARITGMCSGVGTSSWLGNQMLKLAIVARGKRDLHSKDFAVRNHADIH